MLPGLIPAPGTEPIGAAITEGIFNPAAESSDRRGLKHSRLRIRLLQAIGTGIPVDVFRSIASVIDHRDKNFATREG
jgi:hypothetical protein